MQIYWWIDYIQIYKNKIIGLDFLIYILSLRQLKYNGTETQKIKEWKFFSKKCETKESQNKIKIDFKVKSIITDKRAIAKQ